MNTIHGGNVFAIARERGWDWRDVLDFSASINPLGPSPSALAAVKDSVDRIAHYPEREPDELRHALARAWEVDASQILLGNGATELLHFLARVTAHRNVTLAVPVFSEFHRAYPHAATVPVMQPDLWPAEGLLVVTQPVNPTGYAVPFDFLAHRTQPVIIDESFLEFTGLPSCATLIADRPNLFVLRSLTKFYGLPGLRVGALITSPETISRLREYREPWQVNVLAERAALAALADVVHAARTVQFVCREREWLRGELAALPGAQPQPGTANYLFVALAGSAAQLCDYLLDRKILVRNCAGWPGVAQEGVRVAVRTRPENIRLLEAWKEFACVC
ncbi:MAG: aminotransferase class I/II-fold pyridoxal phosphate-dependent enzyme [Bryobacteraceae bacterium]